MSMMLAVPSRGRPGNIARLWEAMGQTCTEDTVLCVGLDADDPELPAYRDFLLQNEHPQLRYVMSSKLRKVTAWTNYLVAEHLNDFEYFGQIGDDNVPRTYGWDTQIIEALQESPFAFGNDLYPRAPGSLCCHVFARQEVPRVLGYFGPPSIAHMYVDVAWWSWGIATKIVYLPDTVIEHLHYTVGKAPQDVSYATSFNGTGEDLAAWHAYSRSPQLNADIRKIAAAVPFVCPAEQYTPEILARFNRDLNIPDRWYW